MLKYENFKDLYKIHPKRQKYVCQISGVLHSLYDIYKMKQIFIYFHFFHYVHFCIRKNFIFINLSINIFVILYTRTPTNNDVCVTTYIYSFTTTLFFVQKKNRVHFSSS